MTSSAPALSPVCIAIARSPTASLPDTGPRTASIESDGDAIGLCQAHEDVIRGGWLAFGWFLPGIALLIAHLRRPKLPVLTGALPEIEHACIERLRDCQVAGARQGLVGAIVTVSVNGLVNSLPGWQPTQEGVSGAIVLVLANLVLGAILARAWVRSVLAFQAPPLKLMTLLLCVAYLLVCVVSLAVLLVALAT